VTTDSHSDTHSAHGEGHTCVFAPHEVAALADGRAVVRDDLFGESVALALAAHVRTFEERLTHAAVGHARHHTHAVRGDRTCWLDRSDEAPLRHLWSIVDAVGLALRRDCYLGALEAEVQLALHPSGSHYQRHRDAFRGRGRRRATLITYLNPDWRPEHGGALRVFEPQGPRDVEPRLGRVLVFLAEHLEHEVLPVHAPRWAATAWFLGPA
jgi:SM-20-related protein